VLALSVHGDADYLLGEWDIRLLQPELDGDSRRIYECTRTGL
jgi:hypothetical protein